MSATIRKIHLGCRALGIEADARHDLQLRLTGKSSLTEMTGAEHQLVIAELKRLGWDADNRATGRKRPAAKRGDVRFCHVIWGKLHQAGAVERAGAAGLNAFVRARFEKAWGAAPLDIDQMTDWRQIASVIEALKAMCGRAGVTL